MQLPWSARGTKPAPNWSSFLTLTCAHLNVLVPTSVDANGYIDPQNPAVANALQLNLNITWPVADLTGLEAFTQVGALQITGSAVVSMSNLPSGIGGLQVSSAGALQALPSIPSSVISLTLGNLASLQTIPTLPLGLIWLVLDDLPSIDTIPPLPPLLQTFSASGLPSISSLPVFPTMMLGGMYLGDLPFTVLPVLPDTLPSLQISMPSLITIPHLPNVVSNYLRMSNMALLDSVLSMPTSCEWVDMVDLPELDYVDAWPDDLLFLDITESMADGASLDCMPVLPPSLLTADMESTGCACLPNIPPGVTGSWHFISLPYGPVPICNALNSSCPNVLDGIGGTVYWDADADGMRDPGETPYSLATVQANPGNVITGVSPDGTYVVGVEPGTYSIACIPSSPYAVSVSPSTHSAVFTLLEEVDTLNDFGVVLQPNIQDLRAGVHAVTLERLGSDQVVFTAATNMGTQLQSGSLSFTYDQDLTLLSTDPAPDLINGNTFTWNFTALTPGMQHQVSLLFHVPIGLQLGTSISHSAAVDPMLGDQTPSDNTFTYTGTVVGSCDPNDKNVEPDILTPAQLVAGERVTYTVRFQNTGTAPALRVVVLDTLSTQLQWPTIELIAASHAHSWFLENGVLQVFFDDINLPDSTADEPNSHGFVEFSIQPQAGLLLGEVVANEVDIYFDFNAPVTTAEAVFVIDDNVLVVTTMFGEVRMMPNPVNDMLTVVMELPQVAVDVDVLDMSGRVVVASERFGDKLLIDVGSLQAGPYCLRANGVAIGRFVKQ